MSTKKDEKDRFIKTTISFDPEQCRRIIEYCNREGRTISWVVRKALAEWLEKQDV